MGFVVFENDGEIDIRSIKTFGVSVKETENPIGYFGTGLKYAIAILLRNKHKIWIQSGENQHTLALKKVSIRGKDFEVITLDDEELSFTTELGKNWQMWQAFREIYCNCLDEAGTAKSSVLFPLTKKNKTRIIVQGQQFSKLYDERDRVVLQIDGNSKILGGDVEVYNKPNKHIYYRGVRVMDLEHESLFTYNIMSHVELTEDRTVKYEHHITPPLPKTLAKLTDRSLIRNVLLAPRDVFESSLNFDNLTYWNECVSKEFHEVLEEEYNRNNDRLNKNAVEYFKSIKNKRSQKNYERIDPTEVEKRQLSKCVEIAKILYHDFEDYNIIIVKTLGQTTFALADTNMRSMVVSRDCFERGTKFLLSTIIEEYAHLKTGYGDRTRELQTWLFDSICTIVENHIIKEPL